MTTSQERQMPGIESTQVDPIGTARVQPTFDDLTGRRFGSLEVRGYLGKSMWQCICDCGSLHPAYGSSLRRGATKSCGCKRTPRTPLATRFWRRVVKGDGCWLWTGARSQFGYGNINTGLGKQHPKRTMPVHRLSYELAYGPIPEGMIVLHRCDNPPCVRPDHLLLGTHDDNMRDMAEKGRSSGWSPQKLSDAQVVEIIEAASSARSLATRFGVTQNYIHQIQRGERRAL